MSPEQARRELAPARYGRPTTLFIDEDCGRFAFTPPLKAEATTEDLHRRKAACMRLAGLAEQMKGSGLDSVQLVRAVQQDHGDAFAWLADEPDLYTLDDGEPVASDTSRDEPGDAFAWLADEPDLYTLDDGEPVARGVTNSVI